MFRLLIKGFFEKFFVLASRIINFLFKNRWTESFGFIYRRSYWKVKLKFLGTDAHFYPNVIIHRPGKVAVGSYCSLAEFVHIRGGCGVTIGNNVMIASHVSITSATHSPDEMIMKNSLIRKPVIIEDNVWIGTHAVILPGITIKSGSVVGAGAVVTKDVPVNVIVAGVPAKIIRHIERRVE